MDDSTKYEIEARAFNLMTGYIAPGKDSPAALGATDYEERERAWKRWKGSLERSVVLIRCIEKEQEQMDKQRRSVLRQAAQRMREARKAAQISVREAAKKIGVSAPYLCDIELGRRQPSIKWLEKFLHVLKKPNAPGEPRREGTK